VARVLIVDDEETDRFILRTILERGGHEVLEAGDGDQALREYRGRDIEVVVTDLHMHNLHGLELISILRELDPRPGIVAISGTGEFQLEMASALGAKHALQKPIVPGSLLSAVEDALAERGPGPKPAPPA
jgi:two-component system chemotaxis response regulator CheY